MQSQWKRSTRCSLGDCVEVRVAAGHVEVCDSKQPDGPVLRYPADVWRHVVDAAKRDGSWLPGAFLRLDDGRVDLVQTDDHGTAELTVERGDWDAFVAGVLDGESDVERLTGVESAVNASGVAR